MCVDMWTETFVGICSGKYAKAITAFGILGRSLNKSKAVDALEREHGISLSDMKPGGLGILNSIIDVTQLRKGCNRSKTTGLA